MCTQSLLKESFWTFHVSSSLFHSPPSCQWRPNTTGTRTRKEKMRFYVFNGYFTVIWAVIKQITDQMTSKHLLKRSFPDWSSDLYEWCCAETFFQNKLSRLLRHHGSSFICRVSVRVDVIILSSPPSLLMMSRRQWQTSDLHANI